ncbi:MAG: type II toxin-antitoxin system RelE/ParE family toxin [Verrucomicrobia bacterium]|jgi:plasmid stabilization system protein ParE|nr:type II toxin-antitoxin system RelE/ParE family toxin [Verrucomicrobiota bacterium]
MKAAILPSARDDLAEGFSFYERQREGLGSYFLESLFSDIDSLRLYAGIHLKMFGYHRLLSKRFPYAIYYDEVERTTRVWAVLDCRQDPQSIRRRLAGLR